LISSYIVDLSIVYVSSYRCLRANGRYARQSAASSKVVEFTADGEHGANGRSCSGRTQTPRFLTLLSPFPNFTHTETAGQVGDQLHASLH